MARVKILKLVVSVLVCQGAGIVGSFFTSPAIPTWYASLEKPSFNPPNWIFAPVWTLLFLLMGISLYLIWSKGLESKKVKAALFIFGGQLILNILWSILFFGLQSPFYAFIEIIILWLAILLTIVSFYKISKPAAYLLLPYILWVSFAGYLNYSIWVLNQEEPVACTMDAKLCPDGSYVSRVAPKCDFAPCPSEALCEGGSCPGEREGILISSPKTNEEIKSPLKIGGEARGPWFFEAQFNAVLLDTHGNKLGEALLTAKSDWMTENLVPFEGKLNFVQPSTSLGVLRFLSANPSGLPEHQKIFETPVQFAEMPYREVLLYYYNPERDKDESGNIKCSGDGLVTIKREIPVSKTPIQDVINLLLKGKENLIKEDIEQGITTEYPLEGLSLAEVNFKEDGTLILKFDDLQNRTSGGSCRVGILWFQIEATAKQFPEVQQVRFLPEEIFQP